MQTPQNKLTEIAFKLEDEANYYLTLLTGQHVDCKFIYEKAKENNLDNIVEKYESRYKAMIFIENKELDKLDEFLKNDEYFKDKYNQNLQNFLGFINSCYRKEPNVRNPIPEDRRLDKDDFMDLLNNIIMKKTAKYCVYCKNYIPSDYMEDHIENDCEKAKDIRKEEEASRNINKELEKMEEQYPSFVHRFKELEKKVKEIEYNQE